MRIFMVTGSPHVHGSSNLLAERFAEGAREAGHQVTVYDAARGDLHPCIACEHCRTTEDGCVYQDDMAKMGPELLASDMIVLVTPLYYFGMTAQIKTFVDRFYGFNTLLREKHMKSAMLAVSGDAEDWTMSALELHYQTNCRYLNFQDQGILLAEGCYTLEDTQATDFPQQAYEFGKRL